MHDSTDQACAENQGFNCEIAPGGIIAFHPDEETSIVRMNQHAAELLGCDSAEEALELCEGRVRTIIDAEDLLQFDEFVQRLARHTCTIGYTYFRVRTKQGSLVTIVMHGKVVCPGDDEPPQCIAFVAELVRFRTVDWLTGLPTMDRFRRLARIRAEGYVEQGLTPVAVSFDLTGFKNYNDRYGRDKGDEVLRMLAQLLLDAFGREACSRFDGDRFFAVGESNTVESVVLGLLASYDRERLSKKPPIRAGLYACEPDDDIANEGLDRARTACDLRRKAWESNLSWFTSEMREAEHIRIHVLENIDKAIAERWIRPYYQGIARSATNEICGEEALARWVDPKYGFLSPAQFIPCVEEAGIAYRIDLHMVECVLADLRTKQEMGVPVVPVSVNFSPSDLAQIDIASEISRRADELGVGHNLLVVEFTESAASTSPDLFRDQVNRLREAGFSVWMDDFGSGYSSLNTLRRFDFDLVKLDMEFVRGLVGDRSEQSRLLVSSILQGISRMGLGTLAEGVETGEQALFLQGVGCDMLQGYLLSRPLPIEDVLDSIVQTTREHRDETAYWDEVGRVDFDRLQVTPDGVGDDSLLKTSELPAGVVEKRAGEWRLLRANDSYRAFLEKTGMIPSHSSTMLVAPVDQNAIDPMFYSAVSRALSSGNWERIAGSVERGFGCQFYIRHLTSSPHADAFAVASIPVLLGSALGDFGDIPAAYAVFRAVLDETGDEVTDAVFTYANKTFLRWLDAEDEELRGQSFLEVIANASTEWLPYCTRAVVKGETANDVIFSPEIGHWLRFSVAPCLVEGYFVIAFSLADGEQREREELTVGLDTSDLIIALADAFGDEASYDVAMNRLLVALSRIAHAKRICLIERGEKTSGIAFEWCDKGVEPLAGIMQNIDNAEFETWDRLTNKEQLMVVPDVTDSEGVDKDHLEEMEARGVTNMLAVPVISGEETLGYLVADNFELDHDLDVLRLMQTVASFVATRMVNNRLVEELERSSLRDALTGLLNRRGIDLAIGEHLDRYPDEPYVLALMDIDDFKVVNDLYGHDVGDEALRAIAQAVAASFPPECVVGRYGGDEFLALMFGCDLDGAERLIEGLLSRDLVCVHGGRSYHLSMSAGYASFPDQADDLTSAYSMADKALYAVKLSGKSGLLAYSPDMERQYRSQLGFTPHDIAESIPGAVIVHRPSFDGELLFANNEAVSLLGCDGHADLMRLTGGVFGGVIHPDDAEAVSRELADHVAHDEAGRKSSLDFRIVTKGGSARHVTCIGRLVEVKGIGKVFYELVVDGEQRRSASG